MIVGMYVWVCGRVLACLYSLFGRGVCICVRALVSVNEFVCLCVWVCGWVYLCAYVCECLRVCTFGLSVCVCVYVLV